MSDNVSLPTVQSLLAQRNAMLSQVDGQATSPSSKEILPEQKALAIALDEINNEIERLGGISPANNKAFVALIDLKEELKQGKVDPVEFQSRFDKITMDHLQERISLEVQHLSTYMPANDPRIEPLQSLLAALQSGSVSKDEGKAKYEEIAKTINYATQNKNAVQRAEILNRF